MQHILCIKQLTIMLIKIINCENISTIRIWLKDNPLRGRYKMYFIYILSAGLHTLIMCGYKIAYRGADNI